MLSRYFSQLKQTLLDFFFPLACLGCGQADTLLCDCCLASITPILDQSCPFCRRHTTPHGETCFHCLDTKKTALDGVFVGSDYDQTLLDTAIHMFKYRSIESLALPLGNLLCRTVRSADLPLPDLIVPVPLHPWRLRYRGFNQSELLSRFLSDHLLPGTSIPLDTEHLFRQRFTLPQQKMRSAEDRKRNIRDAFAIRKPDRSAFKGKSVWLIDDVATTASTLEACARVLKKSGAKSVFGIVLARGSALHRPSKC